MSIVTAICPRTLTFRPISRSWGKSLWVNTIASLLDLRLIRDRYTITADDKIRSSIDLETGFKYNINRNDRYNVKNREAMDGILCLQRLLGLELTEILTT